MSSPLNVFGDSQEPFFKKVLEPPEASPPDLLHAAIQRWLGTPYRHRTCACGRGVDCAHLVGALLLESGAITNMLPTPDYGMDWHCHAPGEDRELVLQSMKNHIPFLAPGLAVCEVPLDASLGGALCGDILLFSTNRTGLKNHIAIDCGNGSCVHALDRRGVELLHYEGLIWSARLALRRRIVRI